MDNNRRNEFRKHLKDGYNPIAAARRAGVGESEAIAEYEQIKKEKEVVKTDDATAAVGGGAVLLIPLAAVAILADLLPHLIFIPVMLCMFIIIFATVYTAVSEGADNPSISVLTWTLVSAAVVGSMIYLGRGGMDASAIPTLWFMKFPGLATGSPFTDAVTLGTCFSVITAMSRDLFNWILNTLERASFRPLLWLFICSGRSIWFIRLIAALTLAPMIGAMGYVIFRWPDATWQLQVIASYVMIILLMAAGSSLARTASRDAFISVLKGIDRYTTVKALDMDALKKFAASNDLAERFRIERDLLEKPARDSYHEHSVSQGWKRGTFLVQCRRFDHCPREIEDLPPKERDLMLSLYNLWRIRQDKREVEFLAQELKRRGFDTSR